MTKTHAIYLFLLYSFFCCEPYCIAKVFFRKIVAIFEHYFETVFVLDVVVSCLMPQQHCRIVNKWSTKNMFWIAFSPFHSSTIASFSSRHSRLIIHSLFIRKFERDVMGHTKTRTLKTTRTEPAVALSFWLKKSQQKIDDVAQTES